jgi:hypothetical protein
MEYTVRRNHKNKASGSLEYAPAMQSTHFVQSSTPTAVEYVPASHNKHAELELAPTSSEYTPVRAGYGPIATALLLIEQIRV